MVINQKCISAEPWFKIYIPSATDSQKIYKVLVPWPDDDVKDLTCECMSFIHRGHCRHQDEAFENLCRWMSTEGPEIQTLHQRKNHICPRCGSTTKDDIELI